MFPSSSSSVMSPRSDASASCIANWQALISMSRSAALVSIHRTMPLFPLAASSFAHRRVIFARRVAQTSLERGAGLSKPSSGRCGNLICEVRTHGTLI